MAKDWKNKKDYDYMDNHTRELWAWEFLRRNPEYRKDWEETLSLEMDRINNVPEETKRLCIKVFDSSCYKENYRPETLSFDGARSKWGLYIDDIINPDIDKPTFGYPFPLFHTYGYYYSKDNLNLLPDLKDSEVLAVFDLAQPIQQQLEYFKEILEEDQKEQIVYNGLEIPGIKNQPSLWKDYIRILDAYEINADIKEIASVICPEKANSHPNYNGNDTIRDRYDSAKIIRDGDYLKILQKPGNWKKRKK